ncbi:hypothetical protein Hanom_Chr01g00002871 [Helianthus anomalus]
MIATGYCFEFADLYNSFTSLLTFGMSTGRPLTKKNCRSPKLRPLPLPDLERKPSTWHVSDINRLTGSKQVKVFVPNTVMMLSLSEPLPCVLTTTVLLFFPVVFLHTKRTPFAVRAYAWIGSKNSIENEIYFEL